MRRFTTAALVAGACCLLGAGAPGATPPAARAQPSLADVLRRFDEVQRSLRTLSAEFTETTESSLLDEAIVAKGRVFLTKPDSVRWEYTAPEEMSFVISEDEYTGYFPKRKAAERRDIRRWSEQLFRFLGLGQASDELLKFYDITLGEPAADAAGTHLLVMDPKKKRVRKRMDEVRFWIDARTYMPVRVEYRAANGNRRTIEFDRMALNPALAANLYRMEIPADVEIKNGFSALSGFSSTSD